MNDKTSKALQPTLDQYLAKIDEPRFSDEIRRIEHDGLDYYSLIDIMGEFTDSKVVDQYWRDTKKRLQKEGFETQENILRLKLTAADGKQRLADVATADICMRVLMSVPTPEDETKRQNLELVKRWMSRIVGAEIDKAEQKHKASRHRENDLRLHQQWGLGDRPEVQWAEARHDNIETLKSLRDKFNLLCNNPRFGQLMNVEYIAMFGMVAKDLEIVLNSKSIRDSLSTLQLRWLTTCESTIDELLGSRSVWEMNQVEQMVISVVKPIGDMLKSIMNAQGLDHITGRPLLGKGE